MERSEGPHQVSREALDRHVEAVQAFPQQVALLAQRSRQSCASVRLHLAGGTPCNCSSIAHHLPDHAAPVPASFSDVQDTVTWVAMT